MKCVPWSGMSSKGRPWELTKRQKAERKPSVSRWFEASMWAQRVVRHLKKSPERWSRWQPLKGPRQSIPAERREGGRSAILAMEVFPVSFLYSKHENLCSGDILGSNVDGEYLQKLPLAQGGDVFGHILLWIWVMGCFGSRTTGWMVLSLRSSLCLSPSPTWTRLMSGSNSGAREQTRLSDGTGLLDWNIYSSGKLCCCWRRSLASPLSNWVNQCVPGFEGPKVFRNPAWLCNQMTTKCSLMTLWRGDFRIIRCHFKTLVSR